ncbi:hypothetical protein D9M69_618960 [compost metagenome]
MKTGGFAVDRVAHDVTALVADAPPARHHPAQAGHGQTALPVLFLLVAQRGDHRVDQHRARHGRRVGVARVGHAAAEDHHLQVHADLRRGQARAVGGGHGVEQIGHQLVQLGGVERGHGTRHAQQARVAHFQDGLNGHGAEMDGGSVVYPVGCLVRVAVH